MDRNRTSIVKSLRENPRVRRIAIPAYRRITRMMVFGTGPRVVVNSVHKSGTHLLTTLLRGLPDLTHSGQHYVLDNFKATAQRPDVWGETPQVDWDRLRDALSSFNRGQFMTSHFQADPDLISILSELNFRTLFILRDPRDVVVSSALYMSRLERHVMHRRYVEDFKTDEERIMSTIVGFPPNENGLGSVSIGRRFETYLGWLSAVGVHSCRFEDLIGPAGGGDETAQRSEVEAIVRHLGYPSDPQRIARLTSSVWSEKSPTFRKGTIGDWRNHFTAEHKDAFKNVAGQVLVELGYERDLNW